MEKRSYSYGMKITGVLLHSFFTIVLTVSVFLLASLVSKNILELTDIETDDFLSSGYYLKCMEQKCNDLNDYLLLTQKGALRTAEDEKRYLQYTNEFKQESTNFCYWYKINGVWYTNQPDTREGQQFDTQTVLMEAKTMGDYLLYDMEDKEFGTDIRGLENYFFSNNGNQIYWPLEDVVLVIGVDTQLSAGDDLRDAKIEYERLHPWIKVSIAGAIISLLGWILTRVYLTLAAGHKEGEEGIALSSIDRIKTELMIAGFVFLSAELVMLLARASSREWEVAGLLVASGTISFLIDTLFLIFYLLCSTAVWLSEPTTLTFGDGLWFSFETVSTIGFGDIPAETPVARAITVVLSVISIFYIAMLTGVAVNYCNTLIKLRQKDTMARFMDDLEHLEELDRNELAALSRRVREYRRRQR